MHLLSNNFPIVLGSLTSLSVSAVGSGAGYAVGDIVDVVGQRGRQGIARVANTTSATGLVTYELVDGGYGYTANSIVIMSDKILAFVDGSNVGLELFQNFQQDLANIEFDTLSGGVFEPDDLVFTYHANGELKGEGIIIDTEQTGANEGFAFIHVISGDMSDDFYSEGNSISANLVSYTNLMATGNLIGWYHAVNVQTAQTELKLGLATINNEFVPGYIVTGSGGFSNTLTGLSEGVDASVNIAFSFGFIESVLINDDMIVDYADVELDAEAFGFPEDPTANISDLILDALNFDSVDFGRVTTIIGQNPGTGYTDAPIVLVYDEFTYNLRRHNTVFLTYNDLTSAFNTGEMIVQDETGARGLIESSNSDGAIIRILNIKENFGIGERVRGESSNSSANVQAAEFDSTSPFMGVDANIETSVSALNGAALELEVLSSGFGFTDGEMVTFSNSEIEGSFEGVAFAESKSSGKGLGFYQQTGGFLSDNKKLYDGFYYQDFSYDIIAPLQIKDYVKLVKQVVHTAGYALFGTFEKVKNESFNLYNYANTEFSVSIVENILENMTLIGVGDTEVTGIADVTLEDATMLGMDVCHGNLVSNLEALTLSGEGTVVDP